MTASRHKMLLAATLLMSLAAPASAEPRRQLVLYAPFDGTFTDESGFRSRIEVYGDEVTFGPGVVNQAVFIGGTDDWITVWLNKAVGGFPAGITVEFWFKRDHWFNPSPTSSSRQNIFYMPNVLLVLDSTKRGLQASWSLKALIYGGSAPGSLRFDAEPIAAHTWYHAAMVHTGNPGTMRLYVNGALVDQSDQPVRLFTAEGPWINLGHESWSNQAYRGYIDELTVYGYARSAGDIREAALHPQAVAQHARLALQPPLPATDAPESETASAAGRSAWKLLSAPAASGRADTAADVALVSSPVVPLMDPLQPAGTGALTPLPEASGTEVPQPAGLQEPCSDQAPPGPAGVPDAGDAPPSIPGAVASGRAPVLFGSSANLRANLEQGLAVICGSVLRAGTPAAGCLPHPCP